MGLDVVVKMRSGCFQSPRESEEILQRKTKADRVISSDLPRMSSLDFYPLGAGEHTIEFFLLNGKSYLLDITGHIGIMLLISFHSQTISIWPFQATPLQPLALIIQNHSFAVAGVWLGQRFSGREPRRRVNRGLSGLYPTALDMLRQACLCLDCY